MMPTHHTPQMLVETPQSYVVEATYKPKHRCHIQIETMGRTVPVLMIVSVLNEDGTKSLLGWSADAQKYPCWDFVGD